MNLVLLDSPERESYVGELHLPSTPDTFKVVRDLIAMTTQQSLARREEQEIRPPAPQTVTVPPRAGVGNLWHA